MTTAHSQNHAVSEAIKLVGKQQVLAERMGCAQQTVSKLLNGEIPVTADWAIRISAATDGRLKAGCLHPALAA